MPTPCVALLAILLTLGCGGEDTSSGGHAGGAGSDAGATGGSGGARPDGGSPPCVAPGTTFTATGAVRINEVMSANDGVAVDEVGETDDWIELINVGPDSVNLGDLSIADDGSPPIPLPAIQLAAGQTMLLWADDDPDQGQLHLPFKLSADGDTVHLWDAACRVVDSVGVVALPDNESLARFPDGTGSFARCRYATPRRENGPVCTPPLPPSLPDDVQLEPYVWADPWTPEPSPLMLSELALRPASFIEIVNTSQAPVTLSDYVLRLAPHAPGLPWPLSDDGIALAWPATTLDPGQRLVIDVQTADIAALEASPAFEGVATLFETASGRAVDRVDFMRWPDGAVLAASEATGRHRFCQEGSPGSPNDPCSALPSRDVGDRVRHLRTPGDFSALAIGGTAVGTEAVKFVIDTEAGDAVHLLSAARWPLHYTFVRETIYGDPPLDRCDPDQDREFVLGWQIFSQREYFATDTRRFFLGTLVHHGPPDLRTVEFALGDRISAEQIRLAFFTVMDHVEDPTRWLLRPQDAEQLSTMLALEGRAPLVGPNAPFSGVTFQPLTEAVGYGQLRFVSAADLETEPLGPDVIVVTDDVPNDIPLVGGLVTEAFQTPLAHVNVLSQARNTPNMALVDARNDPRLAPLFGKLVRLEVGKGGFTLAEADPAEAEAFWQSQRPTGPRAVPRLDPAPRALQALSDVDLSAMPYIGAKASQLAELARVARTATCDGEPAFETPRAAFAIPVVHYLEHFERSGGRARLEALQASADFRADPAVRADGLAEVRQLMQDTPVEPGLLAELTEAIRTRFGAARVRLRSSSNAEDLPDFNGAGLYTSVSVAIDDRERPIEPGLKTVWASLWNARAYDERELANVDHSAVAMGVLVHEAFLSERAQGVAISRNILDPIRGDIYYINAQIGEASVTNPAPGVVTEQLVYRLPPRTPPVIYQSRSSLTDDDVLALGEIERIACALTAMHDHFRPLLDPDGENRLFAMETEFKLITDARSLLLKQARPHPFGSGDMPADCREF